MIEISETDVYGFEAAVRGMRNPMNSWDKSDSYWGLKEDESTINPCDEIYYFIGENDLKLMRDLAKAGSDHGKFLRMINVTFDCIAPLYWWKEADTYGVGVVKNSCSTMHKIHAKEFELSDFSTDKLLEIANREMNCIIHILNDYRQKYIDTKDKVYWWQMIQLLPSSYNQKRTVQLNYAVLWNMYKSRKNHKLDEWRNFCAWIERLPYFKEIFDLDGE